MRGAEEMPGAVWLALLASGHTTKCGHARRRWGDVQNSIGPSISSVYGFHF